MTVDATVPVVRRRGPSLLLPLLLIALGAVLLAGNLGYVPPISGRALLRLWPVLLIVIGVEVALARRRPYLALAIQVLVVVVAVALAMAQPRGLFVAPTGPTTASVPREAATALSLRIDTGAQSYTVAGGATALVDARSEGGEITVRDARSKAGDTAEVRLSPADVFVLGRAAPITVDARVASDVPTTLRVHGHAGDLTIDLSDIRVREARVETGASRLELTLPRPSGDVPVRIEAGAANVAIVVPDGVEAQVTTNGGVLATTTQNARLGAGTNAALARSGKVAVTPGYDAAADRVSVTVDAGASSITIR